MKTNLTDISVILPTYRATPVAEASVARLRDTLSGSFSTWEIIVVDDGGGDVSPDLWDGDHGISVIRFETNRGKGAAVRAGMLAARGRVRVYTDVDLPYGTTDLVTMARYILERDYHLVIGDRTLPGSVYREQLGWTRRFASWIFSAFVGRIVTGGFFDTQCGLKAFRGDIAQYLFPKLSIDRFAFDVEVIYVSLKHRLDIKRVPVKLESNVTSSVRLLRDSVRGIVDIWRIKQRQLLGGYRIPELEQTVQQDHSRFMQDGVPA